MLAIGIIIVSFGLSLGATVFYTLLSYRSYGFKNKPEKTVDNKKIAEYKTKAEYYVIEENIRFP